MVDGTFILSMSMKNIRWYEWFIWHQPDHYHLGKCIMKTAEKLNRRIVFVVVIFLIS